jgi:hypothetical protein
MKYLKLFESHQSETEVDKICRKYGIKNWTLNSDGLVDVDGHVNLCLKNSKKLPLKFGKITGYFHCAKNQLTSLEGAPNTVGGLFDCSNNQLTSLEGSPRLVGSNRGYGGYFDCRNNNIRSFEGLVNIGGNLYCNGNPVEKVWDVINPGTNKWDNEKMEFFNDLDIIRGDEIAIERFNFFLEEIGKNPVEKVRGYKNIY